MASYEIHKVPGVTRALKHFTLASIIPRLAVRPSCIGLQPSAQRIRAVLDLSVSAVTRSQS